MEKKDSRKFPTQKDIVMRHLRDFGFITSFDAFKEYGITRLSAVIFNLKRDYGHDFGGDTIYYDNIYGQTKHYKKYTLIR